MCSSDLGTEFSKQIKYPWYFLIFFLYAKHNVITLANKKVCAAQGIKSQFVTMWLNLTNGHTRKVAALKPKLLYNPT